MLQFTFINVQKAQLSYIATIKCCLVNKKNHKLKFLVKDSRNSLINDIKFLNKDTFKKPNSLIVGIR